MYISLGQKRRSLSMAWITRDFFWWYFYAWRRGRILIMHGLGHAQNKTYFLWGGFPKGRSLHLFNALLSIPKFHHTKKRPLTQFSQKNCTNIGNAMNTLKCKMQQRYPWENQMNKVCAINSKLPSKLFIFWQSESAEKKQCIVSYINIIETSELFCEKQDRW